MWGRQQGVWCDSQADSAGSIPVTRSKPKGAGQRVIPNPGLLRGPPDLGVSYHGRATLPGHGGDTRRVVVVGLVVAAHELA